MTTILLRRRIARLQREATANKQRKQVYWNKRREMLLAQAELREKEQGRGE